MFKKPVILIALLLFSICLFYTTGVMAAEPKRIAVFPLKTGSGISHWWSGNFDPGNSMTEIIINRLLKSDRYQVFDRENLALIMQEHNLGISGEITPETAVKIGKLIGVQYIMTGTVTEFNQIKGGSGASVSRFGISVGGGGGGKVRVACVTKLTNVETGMISAGMEGKKEIPFGGSSHFGVGGVSTSSEGEFASSALGKGMYEVADQVVSEMNNVSFKEYAVKPRIEGYVLQVEDDVIYISVGKDRGVVESMVFDVFRDTQIKDPRTGAMRSMKKKVGEIKVTSVDTDMSQASCSGMSDIEANDSIKQK